MDLDARVRQQFDAHTHLVQEARERLSEPLVAAARMLVEALLNGGRVMACGNGVSAADAEHLVTRLINHFDRQRPGLPAIALTAGSTELTAIANEHGYEQIFARQINGLGHPQDVLVVFSSRGDSANIGAAIRAAHDRQMRILAICGQAGERVQHELNEQDMLLLADAAYLPRALELHRLLIHCLCDLIDAQLLGA